MAILELKVTKAKASLPIETDDLTEDVYREMLKLGAEVLLNRGTSKITKANYPDEAEYKAAAMAQAEKEMAKIKSGDIRFSTKAKEKKASGEVMIEARRIAKGIVKAVAKEQGFKVSHIPAREITAAANQLIDEDPTIIERAKAAVEARNEDTKKATAKATAIVKGLKTDPKKVAAAEKAKAEKQAKARPAMAARARTTRGDVRPSA